MRIAPYIRKAQYHETDRMGIVHHANYIKWFEEARVDFMEKIGISYDRMENMGIISPVLTVSCDYKTSTNFNDDVCVAVKVVFFNGIRLVLDYQVTDAASGDLRATGSSSHCFLTKEFRPINLKKTKPDIYDIFFFALSEDEQE
ncbi:MAG: acyl-CoA thioesterase [Clostridiales bacterium]|nr:acyl-CoA thioesterase [Clostridiales bacterium]